MPSLSKLEGHEMVPAEATPGPRVRLPAGWLWASALYKAGHVLLGAGEPGGFG